MSIQCDGVEKTSHTRQRCPPRSAPVLSPLFQDTSPTIPMPAIPKSGPALFLGLELATDQIRASIVDESLELVGVECVDFDTELPEYKYVPLFRPVPLHVLANPIDQTDGSV